ncbi:MAG TPA: HEAT repeat domain-containing protein [Myxococcales bacterium]|nr:HEAT repeat domain-containing protein [Myxococcales bacterium]
MGLLDMIGLGGPEGKVRRLQKKSMEKFGPKENRQGAIEELGELKTAPAIEALLMRYTFRIDPGITDDEEKARVLALVTAAGPVALEPVKRFISSRDEISWPLRALEALLPEAEVVQFLVEVARKAGVEYSRVPEKKVLLLHALSGHKSPEIAGVVLPFLDDMDDEVQIAAAEVIVKQQDPVGREPLIQHFLSAHEGSNARVREALAGLLAESQWDVKGYTPKVEAALPEGYKLDSKGKVQRK